MSNKPAFNAQAKPNGVRMGPGEQCSNCGHRLSYITRHGIWIHHHTRSINCEPHAYASWAALPHRKGTA